MRFNLHGEFGHPKGTVFFAPGDRVAELGDRERDETVSGIVFREARPDEIKEIETPATDDQTTNPL